MASTRKKTTKDGKTYYEIRCRPERGKEYSRRWYVPDGWSKRAIDRELAKVAAAFEAEVKAGEVLSRSEKKVLEEQQRLEEERKRREEEQRPTLQKYVEESFMPEFEKRCSPNTIALYWYCFRQRIFPALGSYKLEEVTAPMVDKLLLSMLDEGLSQSTRVKVYTALRGVFKSADKKDMVPRNIMDRVDRPTLGKDELKPEIEAYTAAELRVILDCLELEPLKWQALIWLLCDSGIRRGEAVGLKWSDIDFIQGKVTIRRSMGYTTETGVFEGSTKANKLRTIDLSPKVLSLLKAWREEQSKTCLSAWVFNRDADRSAEPMNPQSPTKFLAKFGKRYGIEKLHPHKLRHTFASVAITNGADIVSVSQKLGHGDAAFTLRQYTHANEESIKKAGDIFRKAIGEG